MEILIKNLLEKLSDQQSVAQHFACLHNSHNGSINLSNPSHSESNTFK